MLKYIAISGTTSVTHNMYVYETETEMLVVDCGMGFPDLYAKGVDLVLPDYSYVVKNKHKLVGILLSHGHEDHIGSIPFLLREVDAPIWCTRFVDALLSDKAENYKMKKPRVTVFNEKGDDFSIGSFQIHSFSVTHSIPETTGFAIDTPEGRIFHVAEHKLDQNPPDGGQPFDEERINSLADNVLFLASDSVRAFKDGITPGELHIEGNLLKIVEKAPQAVFFSAISSAIGRFKQIIEVARKTNRKIVFVGYSIMKKCEIAKKFGYLDYTDDEVVFPYHTKNFDSNRLLYIVGGVFGQKGSSLFRLSTNEHHKVFINEGDTVIFSQDPAPPYSKESQDYMVDNFFDLGADVHYYDIEDEIYTSGHGSRGDIVKLFDLVKPKYVSPVGGTIRYMKAYKDLAIGAGIPRDNIYRLKPGESIEFSNGEAKRGPIIQVRNIYVDGEGVGDVGRLILEERNTLSESGVVVAVIKLTKDKKLDGRPEIMTKGFVFEKAEQLLLSSAENILKQKLNSQGQVKVSDISNLAKSALETFFFTKTGRKPMIIPVVL